MQQITRRHFATAVFALYGIAVPKNLLACRRFRSRREMNRTNSNNSRVALESGAGFTVRNKSSVKVRVRLTWTFGDHVYCKGTYGLFASYGAVYLDDGDFDRDRTYWLDVMKPDGTYIQGQDRMFRYVDSRGREWLAETKPAVISVPTTDDNRSFTNDLVASKMREGDWTHFRDYMALRDTPTVTVNSMKITGSGFSTGRKVFVDITDDGYDLLSG
jgi:hypothetical protein